METGTIRTTLRREFDGLEIMGFVIQEVVLTTTGHRAIVDVVFDTSLEQGVIDATTEEGRKAMEEIERTRKMPGDAQPE